MKNVFQKLVSQNVAAVFSGFTTYTSVEFPIVAEKGIPIAATTARQRRLRPAERHHQHLPAATRRDVVRFRASSRLSTSSSAPATGHPRRNRSSSSRATTLQPFDREEFPGRDGEAGLEDARLRAVHRAPGRLGWGARRIRNNTPGIVFSDYAPGGRSAFIKQFRQNPTRSLVYEQYAPSIPEYLDLAGDAANGVLWATHRGAHRRRPGEGVHRQVHSAVQPPAGLQQCRRPVRSGPPLGGGGGAGGRSLRVRQGQQEHRQLRLSGSRRGLQLPAWRAHGISVSGRDARPIARHATPHVPDPERSSRF